MQIGYNQKLTIFQIRARLRELALPISVIGLYLGVLEPLFCRCRRCRHKWSPTWSNLSRGRGCPQCAINKTKLNLNGIKRKLRKISPDIKLMAISYKDNKSPLDCLCLKCNCAWSPSWNSLSRGSGCPQCGIAKAADWAHMTTAEVVAKLHLINSAIKIVGEYKNSTTPIECFCTKHKVKWASTWVSLSCGHGCPQCNQNRPYTLDSAKEAISRWNPEIIVLSRKFTHFKGPLEIRCRRCHHQWVSTLKRLKRTKARCMSCRPHETCVSENKVRATFEKVTGWLFPPARSSEVPWLHGLQLDGYNREHKIAFEYQGQHHYQLVDFGGGKDTLAKLELRKRNDWRKRIQCQRYGVKLIVIPYWVKDTGIYLRKKLHLIQSSERIAA